MAEIDERLAVVSARLGELVLEHNRLLAQRHGTATGDPDADRPPPDEPPDETDRAPLTRPGDLSRVDGRFDRTMLRAARNTLVEAIDAADATLLIDDAAEFQPDWTEDG